MPFYYRSITGFLNYERIIFSIGLVFSLIMFVYLLRTIWNFVKNEFYILDEKGLYINSGSDSQKVLIPYENIDEIGEAKSLLVGLSHDRIKIEYRAEKGSKFAFISPLIKSDFLQQLEMKLGIDGIIRIKENKRNSTNGKL